MRRVRRVAAVGVMASVWTLAAAGSFEGTWSAKVPSPSGQYALPVTFAFQAAEAGSPAPCRWRTGRTRSST
jgi:hypothetical protein